MFAKFEETMTKAAWKDYFKEGAFAGFTVKGDDGKLCLKSEGILPCTPIEVGLKSPFRHSHTSTWTS